MHIYKKEEDYSDKMSENVLNKRQTKRVKKYMQKTQTCNYIVKEGQNERFLHLVHLFVEAGCKYICNKKTDGKQFRMV